MYETKINIFPKGFKKRFLGNFFCVFSKKNYRICKKNIFKDSYIYKFDNVLILEATKAKIPHLGEKTPSGTIFVDFASLGSY